MRILFAAAGTGGHITPALTVARELSSRRKGIQIAFVGTEAGMEKELVKKAGYPFFSIAMQGFRRSLSLYNLKTLFLLLQSPRAADSVLRRFRPELVMGTGGYISYPILKAAKKRGIPTCLHEANAVPGLAVRMSERYTDKLFLHFEAAKAYLKHPEKAETVGMPTPTVPSLSRHAVRRQYGIPEHAFLILSFGGSLGADVINEALLHLCRDARFQKQDIYVIHATGKKHYDAFCQRAGVLSEKIKILPFIDGVPALISAADLTVTRAGAATLAELAGIGRAGILVPSPYVTDDHQRKNAAAYAQNGAAVVIEEADLQGALLDTVLSLKEDIKGRRLMEVASKKRATLDARTRIADEILRLAEARNVNKL